MADIIDSRKQEQAGLLADFKKVVSEINAAHKLVSPLTITLGDEFQGIISTMPAAVEVVLAIEEAIVALELTFKLRYVAVEGLIETPINPEIAYGMMGSGLTRAREYLERMKKDDDRFVFWMKNSQQNKALNNIFIALQEIIDDWNAERDFYLVTAFLLYHNNYNRVAMELKKERSLMWKRRKSLKMNTYIALKEVANYITHA